MVLDAVVLAVLLIFIFWGTKRGLAKMALSAVSYVLSMAAGYVLYRPVSEFLIRMKIAEGLVTKMEESGVLERLPGVMLDVPFVSSAADEIYTAAANAAVAIVSFLAVVIIVRLALFFISIIIGAAGSLPVIHQANGLAGGALGFCLGVVFELIVFAVIGVLEAFGTVNIAGGLFADSHIAALIYNNNPLLEPLI